MMHIPTATALALVTSVALGAAAQQEQTADEPTPPPPREVTLGEPAASDPLAPDRGQPDAVTPRDADGNPLVEGILGVPATRIEVDPRVLGVAPGDPLPALRREGEFLRDLPGKLLPAGERGYAVFVFNVDEEAGLDRPLAMVVAPNRALESMEQLVEQRGTAVMFTVSGQVHTYRGVNYLTITAPPRPWLEDVADDPEPAPEDGQVVEDTPEETAPVEDPDAEGPLSPEDELAELLNQRDTPGAIGGQPTPDRSSTRGNRPPRNNNTRPSLPEVPRGGGVADPAVFGSAPGAPSPDLIEEGAFVVQRTGRLVRSGDGAHALFVFDAAGDEPPMILQACKLLEQMEATVHDFGDHLPFVVTGQVQTYRGANYLLPTVLRQEFDRGNLE